MKELTAMQMMIEEIDNKLSGELTDTLRYSLEECKNMANSLLQKEQEQIEKAFDRGYERGGSLLFADGEPDEGSEYYQSKYVNNVPHIAEGVEYKAQKIN